MTSTCIVISVDDGLLRTSTGCTTTSSLRTLYTDPLKDTTTPIARNTNSS